MKVHRLLVDCMLWQCTYHWWIICCFSCLMETKCIFPSSSCDTLFTLCRETCIHSLAMITGSVLEIYNCYWYSPNAWKLDYRPDFLHLADDKRKKDGPQWRSNRQQLACNPAWQPVGAVPAQETYWQVYKAVPCAQLYRHIYTTVPAPQVRYVSLSWQWYIQYDILSTFLVWDNLREMIDIWTEQVSSEYR